MANNLNMDDHNIINVKDPQPSDVSYAAAVNYVNKSIDDKDKRHLKHRFIEST